MKYRDGGIKEESRQIKQKLYSKYHTEFHSTQTRSAMEQFCKKSGASRASTL